MQPVNISGIPITITLVDSWCRVARESNFFVLIFLIFFIEYYDATTFKLNTLHELLYLVFYRYCSIIRHC